MLGTRMQVCGLITGILPVSNAQDLFTAHRTESNSVVQSKQHSLAGSKSK